MISSLWLIIQNTYSWSTDLNTWIYKTISETTDTNELVTLVENIVLNPTIISTSQTSNTVTYSNCETWIITWINTDYSYNEINHWETWTWTWSEDITDWIKNYTTDITCNDWKISLENENEVISCNTNYWWNWSSCIDQDPPIITSVISSSLSCNNIRFTISANDLIWLHTTPYSFDWWITWQLLNYKDYIWTNLIKDQE